VRNARDRPSACSSGTVSRAIAWAGIAVQGVSAPDTASASSPDGAPPDICCCRTKSTRWQRIQGAGLIRILLAATNFIRLGLGTGSRLHTPDSRPKSFPRCFAELQKAAGVPHGDQHILIIAMRDQTALCQ
jgi:hypothetical protein